MNDNNVTTLKIVFKWWAIISMLAYYIVTMIKLTDVDKEGQKNE